MWTAVNFFSIYLIKKNVFRQYKIHVLMARAIWDIYIIKVCNKNIHIYTVSKQENTGTSE